MVSTWTISYPVEQPFWRINRAYMYAFSFVWWESIMVTTPRGCRLDGLGVALGYSIHINFYANFWNWNSGSWRIDSMIEDGYATIPGGGIFPGLQSVTIEQGRDECNVFPLLRMRDISVPTPIEHIFQFPYSPDAYWSPPLFSPNPLPRAEPYPRVSPC